MEPHKEFGPAEGSDPPGLPLDLLPPDSIYQRLLASSAPSSTMEPEHFLPNFFKFAEQSFGRYALSLKLDF